MDPNRTKISAELKNEITNVIHLEITSGKNFSFNLLNGTKRFRKIVQNRPAKTSRLSPAQKFE